MRSACLLLSFLLHTFSLTAQLYPKDSLEAEFRRLKTMPPSAERDSMLMSVLNHLAPYDHGHTQYSYIDSLKHYAGLTQNQRGMFLYDIWWGNHLALSGEHAEGLKLLRQAAEGLEKRGCYGEAAFANLRIGSMGIFMHISTQSPIDPLLYYEKALALAEKGKDIPAQIRAYTYLNSYYIEKMKMPQKAFEISQKGVGLIRKTGQGLPIWFAFHRSLGAAYLLLGDEDKARIQFDSSLLLARKFAMDKRNTILRTESDIWRKMAAYALEKEQFNHALDHSRKGREAIALWVNGILSADEVKITADLLEVSYLASKRSNRPDSALYYLEELNAAKSKIIQGEQDKDYRDLSIQYETEQNKLRIATLENENLKNRNVAFGGIAVLLLTILGIALWSNRRLRIKNREINQALLKGQMSERDRIAANLHDNLGSMLSAIRWNLQSMERANPDSSGNRGYKRLETMLTDLYDEVRELSHNMTSRVVRENGLEQALELMTANLNETGKTRFELSFSGPLPRFDGEYAHALYSIISELCTNILKHARASRSSIRFEASKNLLSIEVVDDGIGISAPDGKRGNGLRNITQRAAMLGGTFHVGPGKPEGTQVKILIPLK